MVYASKNNLGAQGVAGLLEEILLSESSVLPFCVTDVARIVTRKTLKTRWKRHEGELWQLWQL